MKRPKKEKMIHYNNLFCYLDQDFLHPFVTYHRFISFALYTGGIVGFVCSLVKKHYLKQFTLVSHADILYSPYLYICDRTGQKQRDRWMYVRAEVCTLQNAVDCTLPLKLTPTYLVPFARYSHICLSPLLII